MANYHVTIAVRGRQALARSEAERRDIVRNVARVGREGLLAFGLVDDHFHAAVRGEAAGWCAEGLRRALAAHRRDLELKRPHIEPVGSRAYLGWLVRYVILQPRKHGLGASAALWTGSCFQDLVGARMLSGFCLAPLRNELPRLRLQHLFEELGLGSAPLVPAGDRELGRVGPARLAELSAGAYAVGPALNGRAAPVVAARALAVHAARVAGLPISSLTRFLGVGPRAIRELARRAVPPRAVSTLRRRLALEERVLERPQVPANPTSVAVGSR